MSCSLLLLPPERPGRDSRCPSLVEPQVLQGQAAPEDIPGSCQLHGFPGGDGGSVWLRDPAQTALWGRHRSAPCGVVIPPSPFQPQGPGPQAFPVCPKFLSPCSFRCGKMSPRRFVPLGILNHRGGERHLRPKPMPKPLSIRPALTRAEFCAEPAVSVLDSTLTVTPGAWCRMCPH